METSSGWMDADERADRGFAEDEVLAMPLPVMDDSSDDDEGLHARHAAAKADQSAPAPPAEYVKRLLYGAHAHAHADRGLTEQQAFFDQLREEHNGPLAIPPEHRMEAVDCAGLTADSFEKDLQATPCLIRGVPEAEQWPIAE
eukprot:3058289-Prymnesium_polylepis.1